MKRLKSMLYLFCTVIVLVLLIFVGTAVVQFGMIAVAEHTEIVIPEDTIMEVSGTCGIAMAAVLLALYVKRKRLDVGFAEQEKPDAVKMLGCMVFSVCMCKVLVEGLTGGLLANVLPIPTFEANENSVWDYAFGILVAPVFEELLFRYGLYHQLRQKFSQMSTVIMVTLIFALSHGYQIQGFVSCTMAGILFMLIYTRTGNIRYSIAAHMVCNGFAAMMNIIQKADIRLLGMPLQYDKNGYNMLHPIFVIVALAVCVGYIWRWQKERTVKK